MGGGGGESSKGRGEGRGGGWRISRKWREVDNYKWESV